MSYQNVRDAINHVPQRVGAKYFVGVGGNDSNSGLKADQLLLTPGAAIAKVSAGDAIRLGAGTYTEDSINLNVDAIEFVCDPGVVITPAGASTCLLVSGNGCKISGLKVSKAGQVGIQVTGVGCMIEDCVSEDNTIAFDIDGANTTLVRCRDLNATVTGFDIATVENLLYLCNSVGNGSSRGFYLSNSAADLNMLYQCLSIDNSVAGYEVVSGCTGNAFVHCSSGGGDGVWLDPDGASTWHYFVFDNLLGKDITLTADGTTVSYNLFKVTGIVQIDLITAEVTTILAGENTACHLDVFSANGAAVISKATDCDIGAAVVGSALSRLDKSDKVLIYSSAAGPFINDSVDVKEEGFRLGEDRTGVAHVATYIRFTHTSAAASSGVLHWHCKWRPISHDGFLAAV